MVKEKENISFKSLIFITGTETNWQISKVRHYCSLRATSALLHIYVTHAKNTIQKGNKNIKGWSHSWNKAQFLKLPSLNQSCQFSSTFACKERLFDSQQNLPIPPSPSTSDMLGWGKEERAYSSAAKFSWQFCTAVKKPSWRLATQCSQAGISSQSGISTPSAPGASQQKSHLSSSTSSQGQLTSSQARNQVLCFTALYQALGWTTVFL